MSVWSVYDIKAGHRAVELIKQHGGLVKLGLRPFDYPNEHSTWVPGLGAEHMADLVEILFTDQNGKREVTIQGGSDASPVWVTFLEGRVVGIDCGSLIDADVEKLILQLLAM